jgi:peptidoglycan-associated lipoprotein
MPTTRSILAAVTLAAFAVAASACHHKAPPPSPPLPPPPAASPAPPPPPPPPPPPAPAPQPPMTEQEVFAKKSLDELNAEKPLSDVFFDLDKSDISDDTRATLQKDAEWMRKWTSTRFTVEGHCDSRGTAEYNLALGERRAQAVREYLVSLGITPDRIQTVSKGKEAPFCTEENEACWSQNRRGHFVITAK